MQPIRVLQQVNTTTCYWDRLEEPTQTGLHTLDSSKTFPYLIINMIFKKVLIKLQYIGTCLNCWGKKVCEGC